MAELTRTFEASPTSRRTWDFRVTRGNHPVGEILIDAYADSGSIKVHNDKYTIRLAGYEFYERGILKGTFVLDRNGRRVAQADKETALQRFFILTLGNARYVLRWGELFRRHVTLLHGKQKVGRIRPGGFFTRRALIEFPPDFDEVQAVFVVWLALLSWKRGTLPLVGGPFGAR